MLVLSPVPTVAPWLASPSSAASLRWPADSKDPPGATATGTGSPRAAVSGASGADDGLSPSCQHHCRTHRYHRYHYQHRCHYRHQRHHHCPRYRCPYHPLPSDRPPHPDR
uniref:Putative alpha-protein kinase 1 n=1 Tax=Anopheles marajoara TaxID=58244 RepID=A0A2M4C880_9DIPT